MSGEVSKSVASSASVRFLSANWPIWLPMVASISRSSASGRPISRLKNSRTPMTSLPMRTRHAERGVETRPGDDFAPGEVGVVDDVRGEEGLGALPDPAGQARPRDEGHLPAHRLELGEGDPGSAPGLHAPQDALGRVDLPEARVVPPQGLADRLEDPARGFPKRGRLGERARDRVLRVQPANRLVLGQGFHADGSRVTAMLAPVGARARRGAHARPSGDQSTGTASTGPSKAMKSRHGSTLAHEPT